MENRVFFTSKGGKLGDVIPYYENGEFRPFFLGMKLGWCNASTKDQLHFDREFATGIHGGTGSVIKADGLYHMFYCKFSNYPYQRQWVCHATSTSSMAGTRRGRTTPSVSFRKRITARATPLETGRQRSAALSG